MSTSIYKCKEHNEEHHCDEEFKLTYSEALLVRRALEDYAAKIPNERARHEIQKLGWKIKDAFC